MSVAISAVFPRDAPHVLRFTGIEEFWRAHRVFSILLAHIIHEDSSRKRADAKRDGHSEA